MPQYYRRYALLLALYAVCMRSGVAAPLPTLSVCDEKGVQPAACQAVRGDRSGGWLAQSRSEVMARNGMVATSQPLAAQAGLQVLKQGGNAVDAAVAAAAVLSVVEPMNVGPGGDLFALIYVARDRKVYALNASGRAPAAQTVDLMHSLGYRPQPDNPEQQSGMPLRGILSATVPGAVWGWEEALTRFGLLSFKEVLQPAIEYAESGFPVSEQIARDWELPEALPLRACCNERDPDSVATWYIDGRPPATAEIFRNRDMARTFRLLQQHGRDAFYKGEIAQAIVAKSKKLGGVISAQDLASYRGKWDEPVATRYHGYEVLELPPPSQAWATLEGLNLLTACTQNLTGKSLAALGPLNPQFWHLLIEAKKLAYTDLLTYNADPDFAAVPMARLLSPEYAATRCADIDPKRAAQLGPPPQHVGGGDTIVLSTADRWGNMVSWVNSNYANFGSGVTIPGYGFALHDRGALFTLDPRSPNVLAPRKQPFNTLSAAFVMSGNQPLMTLQLMGGDMQAQGHMQMLVNILDLGANVQAAGDMARFHHWQTTNSVQLESQLSAVVGPALAGLGHKVETSDRAWMGGYQAILFMPDPNEPTPAAKDRRSPVNGIYRGGSEFGKDGQVVGY